MRHGRRLFHLHLLAVIGILILGGCEQRIQNSGQVLARVNGDEISVHQVNFALQYSRQRNAAPNASQLILENMISRQLAVQEAVSLGLDRNPDVMMRLEEARLEALASAYAAEISRQLLPIHDGEVETFYQDNPALFAKRRIYRLREITVPVGDEAYKAIKEELSKAPPSNKTLAWMRRQTSGLTEQTVMRPSNDLPVDIAKRLMSVDTGGWQLFESPIGLLLYEVQSFETSPVSLTDATPRIRENLNREAERKLFSKTIAQLREKAKIERPSQQP